MAKINKIETRKAPAAVGPYSQAVETEKFIFVSGTLPVDPKTGKVVEKEIKVQTDQVIENIKAVLEAAGSGLDKVVRCDVFLQNMNDFKEMNGIYSTKFSAEPKPARQAVEVVKLPLADALIEISCIAYK